MPAHAVGTDQQQHLYLLAFMLGIDYRVVAENLAVATDLAKRPEISANFGVRNISLLIAIGGGQRHEEVSPLLRNRIRVTEKIFVEVFNIAGIGAG